MKRIVSTVLVLCLAAAAAHSASNAPVLTETACKMYKIALQSDNIGLRSSAIFELAKIRSNHSHADLCEYERVLKKMSTNDSIHMVRMNAQLTLIYLQENTLSDRIKVGSNEEPSAFYARLHKAICDDFYAAN